MDDIQELYAEIERLRADLRALETYVVRYVDGEIRQHVRLEH